MKTKLKDIAKEIDGYLKKFEADPKTNTGRYNPKAGLHEYYNAGCSSRGRFVCVWYISYQGNSSLTKAEAIEYLDWLKAGNIGRHYECLKKYNNK